MIDHYMVHIHLAYDICLADDTIEAGYTNLRTQFEFGSDMFHLLTIL